MWHSRRTDYALTFPIVSLLPSHSASQGATQNLVALLLLRVDVLGHRKARREYYLYTQQLTVRFLGGF
jgi:hypothetical protein